MRRAVFITGFNNWGKTTIIQDLFGNRKKFFYGERYKIQHVAFTTEFTVESQSNDDLWGHSWVTKVQHRINKSPDNGENLVTALCPTMHNGNNFVDLLTTPTFSSYDRLHIVLIEYKMEHHAKLLVDNILKDAQAIPNANFIVINHDQNSLLDNERRVNKMEQIRAELGSIF
jgi:hypothetical protein